MELSRGSTVRNNNLNNVFITVSVLILLLLNIIIRKSITIRTIFASLVYVETGFETGASARITFSINGEVAGLRKWKVF